jgi:tetratricopeptide (TPR) repeat protein
LISSKAPFAGDTQADRIAAILNLEPAPLVDYQPDTPADLQRVVGKALQKDRDSRYQHVNDLLTELKNLKQELEFQEKLGRSGSIATHVTTTDHPNSAVAFARRRWKLLAPGAVAVVALIVVGLYWQLHPAVALTNKDTIVLADFVNTTGDSVFEATLKEALSNELARSPFLNVLSDKRVVATLKQMNRPVNQRLTQDVAREVCMRTNSKVYLLGSIGEAGNRYRIELKALNCATGATVARAETVAEDRDTVVKALGEAGNQMRRKLGESLPSLAKFNVSLEQATTSSLEALQALALARVVMREQGLAAGIPNLKRAVELDPNFAAALSTLGMQYINMGQTTDGIPYLQRAFDLRNRLGPLERLAIETRYYTFGTGEIEKAIQSFKEWCEIDPENSTPRNNLGLAYAKIGQHEKAAEVLLDAFRIQPDSYTILNNLVLFYRRLDRLDEAAAFF